MEDNKDQVAPTRDQMIVWYKDEIELATLRAELAKLQRDATVCEAERINAIAAIAQMTQPESEESATKTMRSLKKDPTA